MGSLDAPERWTAATVRPDMWVDPDDDPRDTGVELVDERTTLIDYLRAYRLTLRLKCAGLDAEQMALRSVPPSTMSLLGLIRHMADVERSWFRRVMAGEHVPRRYSSDDDREGAWGAARWAILPWSQRRGPRGRPRWTTPSGSSPRRATSGRSAGWSDGKSIQLREVLIHMVEEMRGIADTPI